MSQGQQQGAESGPPQNNNAAAVQAALMAQSKNMLGGCPPTSAPGYNNYQPPPQVQGRSQMYPYYPPTAKPPHGTPPLNDPLRSPMPNNLPVHPDVLLKRLPFYDHIADLLKPSTLSKCSPMSTLDMLDQGHLLGPACGSLVFLCSPPTHFVKKQW